MRYLYVSYISYNFNSNFWLWIVPNSTYPIGKVKNNHLPTISEQKQAMILDKSPTRWILTIKNWNLYYFDKACLLQIKMYIKAIWQNKCHLNNYQRSILCDLVDGFFFKIALRLRWNSVCLYWYEHIIKLIALIRVLLGTLFCAILLNVTLSKTHF